MTDMQVAAQPGTAPPGFSLDAEASRTDPIVPGIVGRAVELEPDDDDVAAAAPTGDADGDDDDAVDDPDEAGALDDI